VPIAVALHAPAHPRASAPLAPPLPAPLRLLRLLRAAPPRRAMSSAKRAADSPAGATAPAAAAAAFFAPRGAKAARADAAPTWETKRHESGPAAERGTYLYHKDSRSVPSSKVAAFDMARLSPLSTPFAAPASAPVC
jgi:hypothetical protein